MNKEQGKSSLDLMLKLSEEFKIESDRAAVVLSGAYLDYLIGELIAANMKVQNSEVESLLYQTGRGPLGTFSARIDTAYCMGLITQEERSDLDTIRRIRNDFAHKITGLTFDDQSVADRCRNFKAAKVDGEPDNAKDRFKKAAIRLMVEIILRTPSITQSELEGGA